MQSGQPSSLEETKKEAEAPKQSESSVSSSGDASKPPSGQVGDSKEEKKVDVFDYNYMNQHFNTNTKDHEELTSGDYVAEVIVTNKSFISFYVLKEKPKECDEGALFKHCGLKFHVSLPEDDADMFARGWKVVKDILIGHQIRSFKVIRAGLKMSDVPKQRGKDITIYANQNPDKTTENWRAILQEITEKLVRAGVAPGYRNPGTKDQPENSIEGSNYITYRYDDELNLLDRKPRIKLMTQYRGKSRWPKKDLVADIKVNVPNQAPIPFFKEKSDPAEKSLGESDVSMNLLRKPI